MAHPQTNRMIQATHSNDRLNSGIARMNTVRLNTGQARGEGVDSENIFIIAIHPPAPEKLLQLGSSRSGLFVDRSSVLCLNVLDR
jgi:hypothetical protein